MIQCKRALYFSLQLMVEFHLDHYPLQISEYKQKKLCKLKKNYMEAEEQHNDSCPCPKT